MFEARCYASSVVYDGKIIVMGGYDEHIDHSSYNIEYTGKRFKSVEMWVAGVDIRLNLKKKTEIYYPERLMKKA